MIRSLLSHDNYVIVVEHDLSVLDYLSDFICVLYGTPGVYGVVTMPFSVREGINIFLAGFVPTENVRFRDFELSFKTRGGDNEDEEEVSEKKKKKKADDSADEEADKDKKKQKEIKKKMMFNYPDMTKKLGPFCLKVTAGSFARSETIVMLGQNGTGKTTMIKMLAGLI